MGFAVSPGMNVPPWLVDATHTHVELRQALTSFATATIDRAHQARLTALVNELTTLWSVRATMTLGMRRSAVLQRLLGDPAPDLLGILRREDDENSHSDVLRWLLDPRKAPALAPVALRCLVSRFPEAEKRFSESVARQGDSRDRAGSVGGCYGGRNSGYEMVASR